MWGKVPVEEEGGDRGEGVGGQGEGGGGQGEGDRGRGGQGEGGGGREILIPTAHKGEWLTNLLCQ